MAPIPRSADLKWQDRRAPRRARLYHDPARATTTDRQDQRYRALNSLIQGSAADLFKLAAIELHEAGLEAVLYVHDEIVLEVDEVEAEEAAARLSTILASGAGKVTGLRASAAIAPRWSECKG